jgi:hypothetical protein
MSESLHVPEEYLQEVVNVIRAGLKSVKVSADVKYNLKNWCTESEDYLKELSEEDDEEEKEQKPKAKKNTKKRKKSV